MQLLMVAAVALRSSAALQNTFVHDRALIHGEVRFSPAAVRPGFPAAVMDVFVMLTLQLQLLTQFRAKISLMEDFKSFTQAHFSFSSFTCFDAPASQQRLLLLTFPTNLSRNVCVCLCVCACAHACV